MTIALELPTPFKLQHHSIHIVVVGAGGTGGYAFPNLCRLAYDLNQKGERDIILTLVDGDVIEEKNVNRQNFFIPDIGKKKAELLASRHSKLFGMEITSVDAYIEDEESFKEVCFVPGYFTILVGCVDNNRTRQLFHEMYEKYPEEMIWVDSGNKEFAGQVVVGYNTQRKLEEGVRTPHMFKLPSVTEVYPSVLEEQDAKFNSEVSCDDAAVANIQNIAANNTSANCVFNVVNQLVGGDGKLTTFMVNFDARSGSCQAIPTTYSKLSEYYSN